MIIQYAPTRNLDVGSLRDLEVTDDDGVVTVTFAPKATHHVVPSFFDELRDTIAALSVDPAVHAVILTGKDDAFFDGLSSEWASRFAKAAADTIVGQMLALRQIVEQMLGFPKPIVAAINGKVVNIGNQIAFLCDAAVAVESARFRDNHFDRGVAAGDGGTMLWPLLVGPGLARQILLCGRELTAVEARDLYLINEVVGDGETREAAAALAKTLLRTPNLAFSATKLAMNNWWRLSSSLSWDLAMANQITGIIVRDDDVE